MTRLAYMSCIGNCCTACLATRCLPIHRMYPVIPGTMRTLQEDTVLSGYKVPAGVSPLPSAMMFNQRISFSRVFACTADPNASEQPYNRQ